MSNIVFNKKQTKIKRREINIFQKLFIKSSPIKKTNERANKAKLAKVIKTTLLTFVAILIISIISVGIYFAVKSAVFLKVSSTNKKQNIDLVNGFTDIPTYPNSTFAFKNIANDEYVRKLLNSGKSVYILPAKTTTSAVVDYYIKSLETNSWNHVLSVPYESEKQKYGEYWLKNGKGLRIYIDGNDIWYETLTEQQAKTGLSEEVKQKAELKLLLSSGDTQDLRPDYPWILQVPAKYLITYSASDMGELLAVDIKDVTTKDLITIYPVGYYGAQPLDVFLDKYLSKYNKEKKQNWKVVSSTVNKINDLDGIKAILTNNGTSGEAYVLENTRNNVAYVIISFNSTNPLLKYITEKIKAVVKPV